MTRFHEELARAAAMPALAPAGAALWPRFAGYYQGLACLPRRLRRALQRRWRRSLGGIALLCALGQAPALAATINVGGGCTLVDAITAANNDAPTGGCVGGSGGDTLVLQAGSIHTLWSGARPCVRPRASVGSTGARGVTGTVRLWDAESGQSLGLPVEGHGHIVQSVAFSPDGKRLASASEDKTVRLWDVLAKARLRHRQPQPHP